MSPVSHAFFPVFPHVTGNVKAAYFSQMADSRGIMFLSEAYT